MFPGYVIIGGMDVFVLRVAAEGHTMIPQNEEQKKGVMPSSFCGGMQADLQAWARMGIRCQEHSN